MIEKILSELQEFPHGEYADDYGKGVSAGINAAIKTVQEVAKEYSSGWIPCSERLPQEDEPVTVLCQIVNVTLKDGTVTTGWCNRYLEKWYVLDWHSDYPVPREYEDVLAWMPLPAPYQKGE